jgi:hypothetical protein
MDGNEGGEANKTVNIEDGGDDEDMIDDYWFLANFIHNLLI